MEAPNVLFHINESVQSSPSSGNSYHDAADPVAVIPVNSGQFDAMMQPPLRGGSLSAVNLGRSSIPMQKRRRVTRACDECRRKKIRCSGDQPCMHCTVYSYDCSYDQPSHRRRNPAPQYIEALETRLHRLEALLKVALPDVDINNPDLDLEKTIDMLASQPVRRLPKDLVESLMRTNASGGEQDALLESMVEAAGRLELDETGHMDFRGHSSGFAFLQRVHEHWGELGRQGPPPIMRPRPAISQIFEISQSSANSPQDLSDASILPPREAALQLVELCLEDACVLMRFVHRPSFDESLERIYARDPEVYEDRDLKFLPLLYLALAVGCLFSSDYKRVGVSNSTEDGLKYFIAGRRMLEMTDIRDLTAIQTVILMVLFLQSSSKMSTCYSFVGIALKASLRLGLHRNLPNHFGPIETETRKRIFWTVRKMDTYVCALLGLPKGIQDDDIDQEFPTEVDDEFITKAAILEQPKDRLSLVSASNEHTKLLGILGKVVQYIYPIKGAQLNLAGQRAGYAVSHSKVHEIERDIQKWRDELPMELRPGEESERFARPQGLLRIARAHCQMMLYRPFIHYISRPKDAVVADERPYASAAAAINVSREIVHIIEAMRVKGVLNGAYWFTIYTAYFAIISLVYFVLENTTDPSAPLILKDAQGGKTSIECLKENSLAAERCFVSLQGLFERLPSKVEPIFERAASMRKKRSRGASTAKRTQTDMKILTEEEAEPSSDDMDETPDDDLDGVFDFNTEGTMSSGYPMGDNGGGQMQLSAFSETGTYHDSRGTTLVPPIGAETGSIDRQFVGNEAVFLNRGSFDNLEVQLWGPLPPYMSQAQLQLQPEQSVSRASQFGPFESPESPSYGRSSSASNHHQSGGLPVSLDDFFSTGVGDWTEMLSTPMPHKKNS